MKKTILAIAMAVGMALPFANSASAAEYVEVVGDDALMFQSTHVNAFAMCHVPRGTLLETVGREGHWHKVKVHKRIEHCYPGHEYAILVRFVQATSSVPDIQSNNATQTVFTAGRWVNNAITRGQKRRINRPITLYRDYDNHDGPARNRDCDLRSGTVSVVSGTVRNGMIQLNVPDGECDNTWVVKEGLESNTSVIGSVDEVPVFQTRGAYYSARTSMDRDGHYDRQSRSVACKLKVGTKVKFKPFRDWGVGEVEAGTCSGWTDRAVIR